MNPLLKSLEEDVMGFLNEIQLKFPEAISLASGRPDESYFNIRDFSEYLNIYVDSIASSEKKDRNAVFKNLGQYNKTKGIVNNLVSNYLQKDEKIIADPEDLIITVGTQEALAIAVITLCERNKDVIIVEDPTYVGITHFSMIAGYNIEPIPIRSDGISLEQIEEKIISYEKMGKKVRIVYVIPDFQNPTGISMPLEKRHRLLELATKYNFFILEDNAYGEYLYDGPGCLPIKAFDVNKRVIYIRSFAKTIYPSLRIGAMVADQAVGNSGEEVRLSDLMAKTKGYLTVNTPSINQAILGGILIKNNFSLKSVNQEKVISMKRKRDLLLLCMDKYLGAKDHTWSNDISWNVPEGGFFITIRVPFVVNRKEVLICAEKYNLIFTPMSFFYFKQGGSNEIRIAFSKLSVEEIEPAVNRLALYFKSKF